LFVTMEGDAHEVYGLLSSVPSYRFAHVSKCQEDESVQVRLVSSYKNVAENRKRNALTQFTLQASAAGKYKVLPGFPVDCTDTTLLGYNKSGTLMATARSAVVDNSGDGKPQKKRIIEVGYTPCACLHLAVAKR
jgi:hypothetical protein